MAEVVPGGPVALAPDFALHRARQVMVAADEVYGAADEPGALLVGLPFGVQGGRVLSVALDQVTHVDHEVRLEQLNLPRRAGEDAWPFPARKVAMDDEGETAVIQAFTRTEYGRRIRGGEGCQERKKRDERERVAGARAFQWSGPPVGWLRADRESAVLQSTTLPGGRL